MLLSTAYVKDDPGKSACIKYINATQESGMMRYKSVKSLSYVIQITPKFYYIFYDIKKRL